jgi:thiol:disulfide interchange protein DsbC
MKTCRILLLLLFCWLFAGSAFAFQEGGCGAGDCRDCHALSKSQASDILRGMVTAVHEVKLSEVPGLWTIIVEQDGKKFPLYLDFSGEYLISGRIVKLKTREDITNKSLMNLNRVDVSQIPLDDAIVIGNPKASNKIIVFDDPECTYCRKLHPEMQKAAAIHDDLAFFIKLYPLVKLHPKAYDKAKAIICAKSPAMLEKSLRGENLPPPTCETDQVDKNMVLADKLGIKSTPTLIYADGRVAPGYKTADEIIKLLSE